MIKEEKSEIPGGLSIKQKETLISYEETTIDLKFWKGRNQNEGNLYIYKLDHIKFVVNIELNEVYGIYNNWDVVPLTGKYVNILKEHNIPYNMWGFTSSNELTLRYKNQFKKFAGDNIQKFSNCIGDKMYCERTTIDGNLILSCYTYEVGFDNFDTEASYIMKNFEKFRLYFELLSSNNVENLVKNLSLLKYRIFTSEYKNKEDNERKRIFIINDVRYVIDRNTNKVIGREKMEDIEELNDSDVKLMKQLNL